MYSRTEKFLGNVGIGISFQILTYIFTFYTKTIFIRYLGKEYLGIQGLLSNILSLLSLSELGIGAAITFCLYEPLANHEMEKVKSLMAYFKKAYMVVSCAILIGGLSLLPHLGFFIKETPNIREDLNFIYLLFLADSSVSYLFVYKKTIITADQKEYINTIIINSCIILRDIIQMLILIYTSNFVIYLIIQILFTLISNLIISVKANRLYPYLKEKDIVTIDKDRKKNITKKIIALFHHNIGAFLTTGTDNILIAKFIGLVTVGIYSNYEMLIGIVTRCVNQIATVLTPGIGNLSYSEEPERLEAVFEQLFLINYWFTINVVVGIYVFIDPFVEFWIGKSFVLPMSTVLLIVIKFYLYNMRMNLMVFRNALGLFYQDRYKPYIESAINLGSSLVLLHFYGLNGIILGTIIGFLSTTFWVEPYFLYKYCFKKSLKKYYLKYIFYSIACFFCAALMKILIISIYNGSKVQFIFLILLVVIIVNTILIIVFQKNNTFQMVCYRLKKIRRK